MDWFLYDVILIELLPLAKPLSQILRQSYIRDQSDKYF